MEKVEVEEKVEPAPLQVALLYKILQAQREILKHLKETTAEGVDIPLPEKTVTDIATVDLIKDYPYRPLRSIDFFNKGPSTAYYRINDDAKEIPIEDKESITAQRPKATIKYLTLRVESGQSAMMRMVGHI